MSSQPESTSSGIGARPGRLSIAWILVVVITVIVLGVLGLASLAGYRFYKAEEESQLVETGLAMSEQAAIGLSLPLWNFDETQVRQTIESIMRVDVVRGIVVRQGARQDLFLAVERDSTGTIVSWAAPVPRRFDHVHRQPIVFGADTIGHVDVLVTERELQARLGKLRASLLAVVVLVGLLLSASLHFLLWRIMLRPILVLEQYARRIDDGAFASELAAGGVFRGELESLRQSIVRMVKLLADRFRSLEDQTRQHRVSEQRFRTLVDTIPDLIWLKDSQGVYLSCNRMFERFFGASQERIVGRTDFDFVPRELAEYFRENDRKAMLAGSPSMNEEWVTFADDGRRVLLETTKTPMLDPEGNLVGVLGIGRDITARREAEEERRELHERMSNAQRLEALGVLVAGVAHNFNNVLAAILGSATLRGEQATDALDREAYGVISTACFRGRDVVRSLLQFARPTIANQAPLDLHALLTEVRSLLASSTRNRIVVVEHYATEPVWIRGDAGGITNCFMNLCINSIDAMPEGGRITLTTRTTEPGFVEILVQDDGPGIPPEVRARVLEPFFTTKEVGKGTGLGLSMTHGVVKIHEGSMHIECPPQGGTCVHIRLPRIPPPTTDTKPVLLPSEQRPLEILLVDDDDDIRFLMVRMLEAAGHQVVAVPGGKEAVQLVQEGFKPDVVVTDQNMPGMDGIQTLKALRQIDPALPVLVSSGQLDIEEWECFRKPGVGVLSKPFGLRELHEKLSSFRVG